MLKLVIKLRKAEESRRLRWSFSLGYEYQLSHCRLVFKFLSDTLASLKWKKKSIQRHIVCACWCVCVCVTALTMLSYLPKPAWRDIWHQLLLKYQCLYEHTNMRHRELILSSLLLMMSDIRQGCHCKPPECSPQASVLSLIGTDTYLQRKHICPHHKQDTSSGLPVRSSHSCQMPLVHIFTPNKWQVKWMPNTLLSPEGLRCALVTESLAGFKSVSLPGGKKKILVGRKWRLLARPQQQSATGQGS